MLGVRPTFTTGFAEWPGMSECPQLWEGLVGAWCPYLGPTGQDILYDLSGHGLTGICRGTNIAWSCKGEFGWALSMHGPPYGDYLEIPNSPLFDDKRTILMVWKTSDGFSSANDTNRVLLSHRTNSGTYPGIACYLDAATGKLKFFNDPGSGTFTWVKSVRTSWDDETYVIAITADGTNITMYVNGIYENSTPFTAAFVNADATFKWGERHDLDRQETFVGHINAMCIFNRGLKADELFQHYERMMRLTV